MSVVGMSGMGVERLRPFFQMIHFSVSCNVVRPRPRIVFPFFLFFTNSPGAFLAGVPVQPVLLRYPNTLVGKVGAIGCGFT